jgi:prevent-host-death family protein
MSSWTIEDAKARFNEFMDAAVNSGPQILTHEGKEVAVLVSVETWKQVRPAPRPSIRELLLSPEPRFDEVFPKRRKWKRRPPLQFK